MDFSKWEKDGIHECIFQEENIEIFCDFCLFNKKRFERGCSCDKLKPIKQLVCLKCRNIENDIDYYKKYLEFEFLDLRLYAYSDYRLNQRNIRNIEDTLYKISFLENLLKKHCK